MFLKETAAKDTSLKNEEGLKLANKITSNHVGFSGKKMNVKLAAQVLSNSVADAIEFLAKNGDKRFEGSEATVEYIRDSTHVMKYFLTYKCSQDNLEIFFSCVRRCGALNDNPSSLQFRYTLRKLLFRNSVEPSVNANCGIEDDFEMTPVLEFRHSKRAIIENAEASEDEQLDLMFYLDNEKFSYYKNNVLYYMAGCCAKKNIRQIKLQTLSCCLVC
ncbi:unnamed protein product [Euphydryas editha]|uniref:Uncharacterized protein n=1 Tax=Euphydryas editha TaxID=104508 RepID=A0AAU9TMZ6_EUPED|nr:unnamed protein product [Euphydryas editha]